MKSKVDSDKVEILIWDYDLRDYVPVKLSRVMGDPESIQVSADFQILVNSVKVFESRGDVWKWREK